MLEIGQMLLLLITVTGILYLSYRVSRILGNYMTGSKRTGYIRMLDRMALSQDKSLAIIKAGSRYLLIGTSASGISLITELTEEDIMGGEAKE